MPRRRDGEKKQEADKPEAKPSEADKAAEAEKSAKDEAAKAKSALKIDLEGISQRSFQLTRQARHVFRLSLSTTRDT